MIFGMSRAVGIFGPTRASLFAQTLRSSRLQASFSHFAKAYKAPINALFATSPRFYTTQKEVAARAKASRPLSPHLSIYKAPLAMRMSAANRITSLGITFASMGICASVGFFPVLGVSIDSAMLVSAVAALPAIVFTSVKIAFAGFFSYHTFEGLRHLVWASGKYLKLPQVYTTGFITLALAGLSTIYLSFFA